MLACPQALRTSGLPFPAEEWESPQADLVGLNPDVTHVFPGSKGAIPASVFALCAGAGGVLSGLESLLLLQRAQVSSQPPTAVPEDLSPTLGLSRHLYSSS